MSILIILCHNDIMDVSKESEYQSMDYVQCVLDDLIIVVMY